MGPEHRVDTKKDELRKLDWLFPETTKNFSKLPLQYRVRLLTVYHPLAPLPGV